MLLQVILEGLGLGVLLVLVCAVGICKGAVGMVHLYSPVVKQRCVKLGLTKMCIRDSSLYSRSPSESPLHFADHRYESVIVGYYTSAEVPSPRRRQPGVPFVRAFCAANLHRPQAM